MRNPFYQCSCKLIKRQNYVQSIYSAKVLLKAKHIQHYSLSVLRYFISRQKKKQKKKVLYIKIKEILKLSFNMYCVDGSLNGLEKWVTFQI